MGGVRESGTLDNGRIGWIRSVWPANGGQVCVQSFVEGPEEEEMID